jgi:hypothetical protein
MIYSGVPCERCEPIAPEAYVCAWEDRNRLALVLLHDGKGSRTTEHQGIKGAPGIVGRRFATLTVESYAK